MSCLLLLPREIRRKILVYVSRTFHGDFYFSTSKLDTDQPWLISPISSLKYSHLCGYLWIGSSFQCEYEKSEVWVLRDVSENTNLAIRGVCRQLYEETIDILWQPNFFTIGLGKPNENLPPREFCSKIQNLQFSTIVLAGLDSGEFNGFLYSSVILKDCRDLKVVQLRIEDYEFRERRRCAVDWAEPSLQSRLAIVLSELRRFKTRVTEVHRRNWYSRTDTAIMIFQPLKRSIYLDRVETRTSVSGFSLPEDLQTIIAKLSLAFGAEFWINERLVCVDGIIK